MFDSPDDMVNQCAEHDDDGIRMENVSNGDVPDSAVWTNDGPMQLANEVRFTSFANSSPYFNQHEY